MFAIMVECFELTMVPITVEGTSPPMCRRWGYGGCTSSPDRYGGFFSRTQLYSITIPLTVAACDGKGSTFVPQPRFQGFVCIGVVLMRIRLSREDSGGFFFLSPVGGIRPEGIIRGVHVF